MYPLFGDTLTRNAFDHKLKICMDYIFSISKQILDNNLSVILDFGFWRKKERAKVKKYFQNYNYKFFYLEIDIKEQLKRMAKRNKKRAKTYVFTKNIVAELNKLFEEPNQSDEEIEVLIIKKSSTC